jgi:phosphoribosylamine--glycine ligase
MKILVVGGGGREHALCWKIAASPLCDGVYCAPGNAGIADVATCLPISPGDSDAILAACREHDIALVVVGPEQPLVDGLADLLRAAGVDVFGPSAAAAQLEGSKAFAKEFMDRHGIPTAGYAVFQADEAPALRAHLETCLVPTVVKADGLAGGKGVLICPDRGAAIAAGEAMIAERPVGDAGATGVVEEFMEGVETSVFALVHGEDVLLLQPSQDHKRRFDGDAGPNTGGMGAYTPVPAVDAALLQKIHETVVLPSARGMVADGRPYSGLLYVGLMLTADGPRVVEYNCRFGDPETQPVLAALASDLLPLLQATARGTLPDVPPLRWHAGVTICVVLVSGGYPGAYEKGLAIQGLDTPVAEGVAVFHAGTRREGHEVLTAGGRVLGITATRPTVAEARNAAYAAAERIDWPGRAYRNDIGHRAL